MGKMIRWSMKDPAGCIQRGQMSLSQLPGILLSFENSAAETLRRTGSDHVLYAVKIYNAADELTAVQFYMNPMSDEEFHKLAGRGRGTMVYALHNRKVKDAGMKKKIEELLRLAMKVQEKTSAYVSFETSNHGWECVVMIMDDGFEINHGYDGWYEMDIFYPDERSEKEYQKAKEHLVRLLRKKRKVEMA